MISFLIVSQEDKMLFFRRKKQEAKEAQIQTIRTDMHKKIDKATRSIDKLNDLLEATDLGITGQIFYATGGQNRHGRKR